MQIKQDSLLKAMSDDKAYARALKEYLDDKAQTWTQFQNAVLEVFADDDIKIGDIDSFIANRMPGFYPYSYVPLNNGSITLRALLVQTIQSRDSDDPESHEVELTQKTGSPAVTTIENMFSEIQESLHSIVVFAAAAGSMAFDSVTDRLTIFRDHVSRTFTSAFAATSGSLEYFTSLIEKSVSVSDFVVAISESMDIDNIEDIQPTQSNVYEYTGASPVGPLDFGSVAKVAGSVIKTGSTIVKSAFKGLWGLGKKVFSSVASKVSQLVSDPFDIEQIDGSPTNSIIDGFHWQDVGSNTIRVYTWIDQRYDLGDVVSMINDTMVDGSWRKFTFKTGHLLFKVKGASVYQDWTYYHSYLDEEYNQPDDSHYYADIEISYEILFQPTLTLIQPLKSSFPNQFDLRQASLQSESSFRGLINNSYDTLLQEFTHKSHGSLKQSEQEVFNGFANGFIATMEALSIIHLKLMSDSGTSLFHAFRLHRSEADPIDEMPWSRNDYTNFWTNYGTTNPTNADFVAIASGYKNGGFDSNHFNVKALLGIIFYQAKTRVDHPLDYMFIPYERQEARKEIGQYRIKTDSDNYQAFNKFINAAIVIIAVATVATVGLKFMKSAKLKAGLKYQALQKQTGDKVLAGTATKADFKLLKKARKKNALLNGATSAMVGSGHNVISTFNGIDELTTLIQD